VVRAGAQILSNVVASQTDLAARYGGVVPEQASRAHLRAILPTLDEAFAMARADWDVVDAIAAVPLELWAADKGYKKLALTPAGI